MSTLRDFAQSYLHARDCSHSRRLARAMMRQVSDEFVRHFKPPEWTTPMAQRLRLKGIEPQTEHAYPLRLLHNEILARESISEAEVEELIGRLLVGVYVTKAEHLRLNKKFKQTMPQNWDGKDMFARYKAVGLELERVLEVPPKVG